MARGADWRLPERVHSGLGGALEQPDRLPASLHHGPVHTELSALGDPPELVIWPLPVPESAEEDTDALQRVHTLTRDTLTGLQDWLARPDTLASHLVIITRDALATTAHDRAPDLAHAAAWALIHTTQNEHPPHHRARHRRPTATYDNLLAVLAQRPASEPQLAMRHGAIHIPRLSRPPTLQPPHTPGWNWPPSVRAIWPTWPSSRRIRAHR